jgi:hypothetical protein
LQSPIIFMSTEALASVVSAYHFARRPELYRGKKDTVRIGHGGRRYCFQVMMIRRRHTDGPRVTRCDQQPDLKSSKCVRVRGDFGAFPVAAENVMRRAVLDGPIRKLMVLMSGRAKVRREEGARVTKKLRRNQPFREPSFGESTAIPLAASNVPSQGARLRHDPGGVLATMQWEMVRTMGLDVPAAIHRLMPATFAVTGQRHASRAED